MNSLTTSDMDLSEEPSESEFVPAEVARVVSETGRVRGFGESVKLGERGKKLDEKLDERGKLGERGAKGMGGGTNGWDDDGVNAVCGG